MSRVRGHFVRCQRVARLAACIARRVAVARREQEAVLDLRPGPVAEQRRGVPAAGRDKNITHRVDLREESVRADIDAPVRRDLQALVRLRSHAEADALAVCAKAQRPGAPREPPRHDAGVSHRVRDLDLHVVDHVGVHAADHARNAGLQRRSAPVAAGDGLAVEQDRRAVGPVETAHDRRRARADIASVLVGAALRVAAKHAHLPEARRGVGKRRDRKALAACHGARVRHRDRHRAHAGQDRRAIGRGVVRHPAAAHAV